MSNNITVQSNKPKFSIKGKQFLMRYDSDFNRTILLRQRYFFTPGTSDVFTPITSTIGERLTELIPSSGVPTALPFTPRKAIACFPNPNNAQGFSEYQVFIPFAPTDDRHKVSLDEVKEIEGVSAVKYEGEAHDIGIKNYVRS